MKQDFMSIKAWVLSPAVHFTLCFMCLQMCVVLSLMSIHSTLAPCEKISERGTLWCEIRKANGWCKQGNKCSDRSRPREPENRLLTQSGECQRRLPREGDAWTSMKGAMRIIQIKGMRILKQSLLDFSFQ